MTLECSGLQEDSPLRPGALKFVEELQKLLESKQVNIGKCSQAAVETMKAKRQKAQEAEVLRKSKAENSVQQMVSRFALMKKAVTEERDALDEQLREMDKLEKAALHEWEQHHAEKESLATAVSGLWDKKIDELQAQVKGQQKSPEKKPVFPESQVAIAEVLEPKDPLQEADDAREADYWRRVSWEKTDLPEVLPTPVAGEYAFWLRLACNVQEWAHVHGSPPCTFLDLMKDAAGTVEGADVVSNQMSSVASLVGMDYWIKMYGSRVVLATDIVPQHMGWVLIQAMTEPRKAAETKLGEEAAKEETKQAKAAIKAALASTKARSAVGRLVRGSIGKP